VMHECSLTWCRVLSEGVLWGTQLIQQRHGLPPAASQQMWLRFLKRVAQCIAATRADKASNTIRSTLQRRSTCTHDSQLAQRTAWQRLMQTESWPLPCCIAALHTCLLTRKTRNTLNSNKPLIRSKAYSTNLVLEAYQFLSNFFIISQISISQFSYGKAARLQNFHLSLDTCLCPATSLPQYNKLSDAICHFSW